jgi:hypothetical protein
LAFSALAKNVRVGWWQTRLIVAKALWIKDEGAPMGKLSGVQQRLEPKMEVYKLKFAKVDPCVQ